MMTHGKALLDRASDAGASLRARRYARIERSGDANGPGVKEMAMTRRPRDESASQRAERFLAVDRYGSAG